MIVRKIKPEEVKRTEELFSIAFDTACLNELTPMELYQKYTENPKSREEEHCLERFAAFEDDDETMVSCFIMQPFTVYFDGYDEAMYSIGGVATLPQYRRRGGVRKCFEKALPYLYEKGAVFSYLYPFSTSYYRKFGYEMCSKRQIYRIALQHIPSFGLSGSCYLVDCSNTKRALHDISQIYNIWQKKYNMMTQCSDYDFNFVKSANSYKEQVFTYIYCSAEKEPLAYMTFCNNTTYGDRYLQCTRFYYVNKEGLKGLLNLAKSFLSDFSEIRFSLPEGYALEQILPEWSMGAVNCQMVCNGMVRVINVKKVLQDAAYRGSGSISLQVTDSFIEENNGTFRVEYENGVCKEVICSMGEEDVSLSISSFSALIAGGYDTDAVDLFEDVKIYRNCDTSGIFYKKQVYITSSF